MSHDGRFLLYSTIGPIVHLVKIAGSSVTHSITNVTEVHEAYDFEGVRCFLLNRKKECSSAQIERKNALQLKSKGRMLFSSNRKEECSSARVFCLCRRHRMHA
jgi:hypothetical protein